MRINRVKNLIPAPKDGQKLYLVVTPLQLGLDKNSNWKGGVNTVTVEVWRQKGNDEPTQSDMGAYSVIVYKNGSSAIKVTKLNTASFTFEASKSDTSYEIVLKVNSKKADSKTVIISADGITGVGVSSVTEYYLASSSGSGVTTSTSGWTTDPTAAAATLTASKKYLWNYEKVTYTDGTSVDTTPAIIGRYGDKGDKGDQGNTGVSITSVTEYYLASANYTNVTRSTSGWTTDPTANAAKLTASKKYLWNYEVIGYSDGSTDETDPAIIGVYGDKGDKGDQGNTGKGISSITEYYLASASGSGVTTSTSGWTTDPTAAAATLTSTKKYLWNYEKVTYTDGSEVKTTPAIIGRYGDKGDKGDQGNTGVSITSVTEYYLASANKTNVTRSTSGWTTDPTANAAKLTASKKYLWNYEVIGYSDGSTDETDPVIIGVYGDKGDQGNTGKGISSITEYYLASASGSGVTTSTSGWTTDPTAAAATLTSTKKYLWNYEKVTYTDGSEVKTTPAIIGRYGDKGDKGDQGNTGVSITSVTEYYLASSAYTGVTRSTSGWTTDPTATAATITASKKYLWNYEVIGYSDGSTDETDPVIIGVYGDKGDKGNTGTGISSTTWYYLATTMATGVTRSTSGWSTSYQQGTPDLPYVWRYGDTLLTNGTHQYTACELVFSYSAGANPNLLEQTNFSSLQALDKWTTRNLCEAVSGVSITQESYASIQTGIQAHNAYYDETIKTTAQIQYKEVLKQCLWNTAGTIRKLEPSTWYTFSFWAKGDNVATFIYPSVFDNTSICYKDGVMQSANTLGADAYILWSLNGTWKRHTFTFKTKSTIGNANQNLLFRLYPKASASTSNKVYICMPKLEVGMQATSYISNEDSTHTGQPRNRRWALNTEYFCGAVDERYDDTVLVGESGFYHCIKTHVSSSTNCPGTGTNGIWEQYWEQASKVDVLATDIFFAEKALINNLIATLIQTGYSGSPHIEAEGSEFKIFGRGQYPAIYLAVNSDNKAVLRFQNENTGEFLYDLGPDGIMKEFSEVADSYTQMKLKKLTNVTRVSEIIDIAESACTTYYRFNEGYKQIGSGNNVTKQYHVSGGSSPSAKNAQFFTSQNYNGSTIADGWYVKPNNGMYLEQMQNDPNGIAVKLVYIYQFSGGKLVSSVPVYFLYTDSQHANQSVGCDENGNELSTSTYTYLYSYYQSQLTPY